MKEIENKIKNSIQINGLYFFDKLPEIKKKTNYKYILALATIVFLFVITTGNMNSKKSILDQNYEDIIIFNQLSDGGLLNNKLDSKYQLELMYGYDKKVTTVEEINKYYKLNIKGESFIKNIYTTHITNDETILGAEVNYTYLEQNIKVQISDNLATWNIETNGFIESLNKKDKSIIDNKQITLAKINGNEPPKYIMYEYINKENYVLYALYEKDNLFYYITSSNISSEIFIMFLKEVII